MAAVLLFLFGCLLCLMFLGMLYGERLSLTGLTDGEWFSPIGVLASKLWNILCESVDESIEFVLTHLSWVVAAVSGTAGLILVAFLMGGGLASDAAAYHRDTITPLRSGGVLDKIERVTARGNQAPIMLARAERDDSQFVTQAVGSNYLVFGRPEYAPIRPRPRRPIEGGVIDRTDRRPVTTRPRLDVTFRRLGSSVIRSEANPDISVHGRLVDDLPDPLFVDRALRGLLRDNWREGFGLSATDSSASGIGLPGDTLQESPLAAVRELESRVRVTPGILVAEHDLRVEKTAPEESGTGEVTLQISLTNLGNDTIDGLLVRELLPFGTLVRGAEPEGILRDDTLTWLINDLQPSEELMLRFTVLPSSRLETDRDATFASTTEVSALVAVTTRTVVAEETSLPDPFPTDRRRDPVFPPESPRKPDLAGAPDLRLSITEPRGIVSVGKSVQVIFTIANEGTVAAEGVTLRLTLDEGLDHKELVAESSLRTVSVYAPAIRAGESRDFRLEVRPNTSGELLSTADLLFDDAQIDLATLRLVARDADSEPFTPDTAIQ